MPQLKSGYKRLKKDKKRQLRNQNKISEIKTLMKNVRTLIAEKKAKEAETALRLLESKFCKAAKTNTVKKENVSRRIGRLKKQVAAISK